MMSDFSGEIDEFLNLQSSDTLAVSSSPVPAVALDNNATLDKPSSFFIPLSFPDDFTGGMGSSAGQPQVDNFYASSPDQSETASDESPYLSPEEFTFFDKSSFDPLSADNACTESVEYDYIPSGSPTASSSPYDCHSSFDSGIPPNFGWQPHGEVLTESFLPQAALFQSEHVQPYTHNNGFVDNYTLTSTSSSSSSTLPLPVKTEMDTAVDGVASGVPIAVAASASRAADVVQSGGETVQRRGRKRACEEVTRKPAKREKKIIIETPRGKSFVSNLYTAEERREKIRLYKEKKQLALSRPSSTKYPRRARFASARPRVGGRFVPLTQLESASIVNGTWKPNATANPLFPFAPADPSPSTALGVPEVMSAAVDVAAQPQP